MRTLLSLPYPSIYLHEDPAPVLELRPSADFRSALLQAIHLAQQHQVRGWIAGDCLKGAIRPRDVEWAEQEILLPLHKLGLARLAHLEAQDALHHLTVDQLLTRATPSLYFGFRHFDDLAASPGPGPG